MRHGNNETALMHEIHEAIARSGRALIWRNSVGGVHGVVSTAGRVYRANVQYGLGRGSADLVGILRGGRFIALEVKTPSGRVGRDQISWMHAVRSAGGFASVVRSVDEAMAALDRAAAGEVS
jgi:hypothetical protein